MTSSSVKPTITVQTLVNVSAEKAWELWTGTEHIVKWNTAHPDWHTTRADHDVKPGGKFNYRMEAKDGSFGFDFEGIFTDVKPAQYLAYMMSDGRHAHITFTPQGNGTHISETFEAEQQNPLEMQQAGWQAILDNFKKYAEIKL